MNELEHFKTKITYDLYDNVIFLKQFLAAFKINIANVTAHLPMDIKTGKRQVGRKKATNCVNKNCGIVWIVLMR